MPIGVVVIAGVTGRERGDAHLGGLAPAEHTAPSIATATRAANASDSDEEGHGAVREVVTALGHTRADHVALQYTARDPSERLLHEHLAEPGIWVNGPGSCPVVERALARTVLELPALGPTDLPRADFFRALGDVGHDFPSTLRRATR